jgi:hypothetical protein
MFPADGGAGRSARGGTGSDCAGVASFPGRGDGVAGQAGAGRADSRRQQVRKASFQGQVRLIFSTRAPLSPSSAAGDHTPTSRAGRQYATPQHTQMSLSLGKTS